MRLKMLALLGVMTGTAASGGSMTTTEGTFYFIANCNDHGFTLESDHQNPITLYLGRDCDAVKKVTFEAGKSAILERGIWQTSEDETVVAFPNSTVRFISPIFCRGAPDLVFAARKKCAKK